MNLSRLFEPDEGRDALRKLGGLLIGLGLFLAFARKSDSSLGKPWGDWGLLIVLLGATVFLYGVGLLGRLNTAAVRPWQSVYVVFAVILVPFTLFQFVEAINGTSGAALNVAWVFLVTATLATVGALVADVRYGLLLAAIAVIVSWCALWDRILSGGLTAHYGIFRGLLVIVGLLLVAAAYAVYRLDPLAALRPGRQAAPEATRWIRAQDVVTGAAIAGVGAGALTFSQFFAQAGPLFSPPVASPSLLWDIVLLVASLLAVAWGARFAVRGPTYVGAIGLFVFVIDIGSEIGVAKPEGTIVGWPLILVIVGAVAFAASLLPNLTAPDIEQRLRSGGAAGGPGAGAPTGRVAGAPPTSTGGVAGAP